MGRIKTGVWICICTLMLCNSACSKREVKSLLDDIARDTYERNAREQRNDNSENAVYEEPPGYDEYHRERKVLLSD